MWSSVRCSWLMRKYPIRRRFDICNDHVSSLQLVEMFHAVSCADVNALTAGPLGKLHVVRMIAHNEGITKTHRKSSAALWRK